MRPFFPTSNALAPPPTPEDFHGQRRYAGKDLNGRFSLWGSPAAAQGRNLVCQHHMCLRGHRHDSMIPFHRYQVLPGVKSDTGAHWSQLWSLESRRTSRVLLETFDNVSFTTYLFLGFSSLRTEAPLQIQVVWASGGSSQKCRLPGPASGLLTGNLHCNKIPRQFICT